MADTLDEQTTELVRKTLTEVANGGKYTGDERGRAAAALYVLEVYDRYAAVPKLVELYRASVTHDAT